MKLQKLHLQNFRRFEDLEITFPTDSNIAVFIGENGSGKSSILDAIAGGLSRVTDNITFVYQKLLSPSDTNIKATTERTLRYSLEHNAKEFEILLLNSSEILVEEGIKELADNIFLAVKNTESPIPILLSFTAKRREVYRLPSAYPKVYVYADAWNKAATDIDTFKQWFEEQENAENEQRIHLEDNTYREPSLELVRTALQTFLNNLGEEERLTKLRIKRQLLKRAKENPLNNIYQTDLMLTKDGIELKASQLSEGEQLLIVMVGEIAKRLYLANPTENPIEGNGIVLIDEIEQHLHPKWQRRVLPALTKTFPNIQFIVTTHSPLIINGLRGEELFVLGQNVKDKLPNINLNNRFVAWSSEDILKDIMGVTNTLQDEFVAPILDKLDDAFDNNDKALYQENLTLLEELLSPNDPLKTVYRLKQVRLELK